VHTYHPEQVLALHHVHRTELQRAVAASREEAVRRDRTRAVRLAARAERFAVRAARRALVRPHTA